jgi:hypothetical protein
VGEVWPTGQTLPRQTGVAQATVVGGAHFLWQKLGRRNEQSLILGPQLGAQQVFAGRAHGAGLQYFAVWTHGAGLGATQATGAAHPHLGL